MGKGKRVVRNRNRNKNQQRNSSALNASSGSVAVASAVADSVAQNSEAVRVSLKAAGPEAEMAVSPNIPTSSVVLEKDSAEIMSPMAAVHTSSSVLLQDPVIANSPIEAEEQTVVAEKEKHDESAEIQLEEERIVENEAVSAVHVEPMEKEDVPVELVEKEDVPVEANVVIDAENVNVTSVCDVERAEVAEKSIDVVDAANDIVVEAHDSPLIAEDQQEKVESSEVASKDEIVLPSSNIIVEPTEEVESASPQAEARTEIRSQENFESRSEEPVEETQEIPAVAESKQKQKKKTWRSWFCLG